MKGLLLKDWYLITRYCRAFFLMDAVFIGVSLFTADNIIFMAYPCMFSAMITVTLYIYDEKEKWTAYSAVLPVSRAQYVSAKYIIGLLSLGAVFVVSAAAREVTAFAAPQLGARYMSALITACALGVLLPAVVLPLMFRFGAEKGRIIYIFFVGAFTAVCFVFLGRDGAPGAIGAAPAAAPALLLAAALGLYGASWLLSIRLYRRREL